MQKVMKLAALIDSRLPKSAFSLLRPANVMMFHVGRSGSTTLGDLLNQHGQIFWDGEVYEHNGFTSHPIRLLRKRMPLAGNRIYGAEVKFFHLKLLNTALSAYLERLQHLGFEHFIILERKNLLRKVVSAAIAHQHNQWNQPAQQKSALNQIRLDPHQVRIDRDDKPLIAYLEDYQTQFAALRVLLRGHRSLSLTYEDDILADPLVACQRVCDFLEIPLAESTVRFGKMNPFSLEDIVLNFDEVAEALHGTSFEWMLHSD